MELETINKLYLELSQITTATTAREILLQKQLAEAQKDSERLDWIEQSWFYRDSRGTISFVFNDSWDAGTHDSLRAAIDAERGETS